MPWPDQSRATVGLVHDHYKSLRDVGIHSTAGSEVAINEEGSQDVQAWDGIVKCSEPAHSGDALIEHHVQARLTVTK